MVLPLFMIFRQFNFEKYLKIQVGTDDIILVILFPFIGVWRSQSHDSSPRTSFPRCEPQDTRFVVNYRKLHNVQAINLGPSGHEDTKPKS